MAIVSVSLNDKIIEQIKRLEKANGFSGRSEVIRAAVRSLISEQRQQSKIKGKVDAILIVVHDESMTQKVSSIKHKYQRLIKSEIHNHLENHDCLELYILNGESEKIIAMHKDLLTEKKIELVKLVLP